MRIRLLDRRTEKHECGTPRLVPSSLPETELRRRLPDYSSRFRAAEGASRQ